MSVRDALVILFAICGISFGLIAPWYGTVYWVIAIASIFALMLFLFVKRGASATRQRQVISDDRAKINPLVDIEAIWEDGSYCKPKTVDLSNSQEAYQQILLFGNGCYDECRAVGHSKEAIFYFIRLVQNGGYEQGASSSVQNKKLYREGDGCFPAYDPFIFISPETKDGGLINFSSLESDIQTFVEAYEKTLTPQP